MARSGHIQSCEDVLMLAMTTHSLAGDPGTQEGSRKKPVMTLQNEVYGVNTGAEAKMSPGDTFVGVSELQVTFGLVKTKTSKLGAP